MAPNSTVEAVTIHERCRVAPPTNGGAAHQSLPLVFFDMVWLHFGPIQRLLFYKFPCSTNHFIQTIIPNIKKSLSQTLDHYLPLAGNLIHPLDSAMFPEFRYVPGDSVPLTIAISNKASDFNYLTGDNPRVADEFYSLVPELPEPKIELESGFKIIPLFAVQVTLFPGTGICLGITNHHTIGDGRSIVGFIKAWSSIAMLSQVDNEYTSPGKLLSSLPFYDRSVIKDPSGLAKSFWTQMDIYRIEFPPMNFPTNKVRATYTMQKTDIENLKNSVRGKKPSLFHLSSFTITTAYVWTCLVRSAAESGEEVPEDEPEYFAFAVDARARLDPPVPAAYFGNCVAFGQTESTHGRLRGDLGFPIAVELIGEVIGRKVNSKDEILRGAEKWMSELGGLTGKRCLGVAGSPRFDLYEAEFGWGKAEKCEVVSIDGSAAMSLCKSRGGEGGLEIGLSLPEKKMGAFAHIFSDGLKM